MVPNSVLSEVTSAWNQDTPLELADPEQIYQGYIRAWIESGTGDVEMGGKGSQECVVPTVLEDYIGALTKRCGFQRTVELSAVRM